MNNLNPGTTPPITSNSNPPNGPIIITPEEDIHPSCPQEDPLPTNLSSNHPTLPPSTTTTGDIGHHNSFAPTTASTSPTMATTSPTTATTSPTTATTNSPSILFQQQL